VRIKPGREVRAVCAGVGPQGLQPGLIEQEARDHAVHDLQHRRHQLRVCGQRQAPRDGQPSLANPHLLAYRQMGDDVVDETRCGLRHASRPMRHKNPQRLQSQAISLSLPQSAQRRRKKAVRWDAALEEGLELVLDE
jgi:hypothetical protein